MRQFLTSEVVAAHHNFGPSTPGPYDTKTAGPTLLLVDRDPLLLRAFERILKSRAAVFTATSGTHALRRLERSSVDAVVCSYSLPETTGAYFLEQVRIRYPSVRRFMMSSMDRDYEEYLQNGLYEHVLSKPFSASELHCCLGV